jgi:D-serine deaminase-like pyridoxal phosphate-dependent protein
MAAYFAGHGWRDLTLAVPVNHGQLHAIRDFDPQVRLNLLVDSAETIIELHDALSGIGDIRMKRSVWIKVDVGYGRVGIQWSKEQELLDLVRLIGESDRLEFGGLLTHSGHTYDCRGREEVIALFEEVRARMLGLQRMLGDNGITAPISMGDTPSASLAENFDGVDEMRPGNFVFYDLVQSQVGSCRTDDIAVATACPVIGKYKDDLKVVVYGGAVHLSKDSIMIDGERIFGQLALPAENGWEVVPLSEGKMVSCCQEVSKLKVSPKVFERIELGKTVYILPAHSCLAAEMHPRYLTTNGKVLERFRLYT